MICGIGADIIEIERIKNAVARSAFQKRVFTDREILLCKGKADFYAALAIRFAAKEAVLRLWAPACGVASG